MKIRKYLVTLLAMAAFAGAGFYLGREGAVQPVRTDMVKEIPAARKVKEVSSGKEMDMSAASGSNVRWMDGENGTRMVYELGSDKKKLSKRVLRLDGTTEYTASYWLGNTGQILGCKIGNADGKPLYNVLYGYRKSDGKLVEERIFDAAKGKPETRDQAVCRVRYVADRDGTTRVPVILGRDNEQADQQLVGIPSALFVNPFADRF